jgi:hypothetical protein
MPIKHTLHIIQLTGTNAAEAKKNADIVYDIDKQLVVAQDKSGTTRRSSKLQHDGDQRS